MKAKLLMVEKVSLHFTEGDNPAIVIGAEGFAPTFGWKNAELVPRIYITPPEDGIWDFDFVADAPVGITLQILTRVTSDPFVTMEPPWFKGVRIHASNNVEIAELSQSEKVHTVYEYALTESGVGNFPLSYEPRIPGNMNPWPMPQQWPDPKTKKELDKIKELLACRGLTDLELLNQAVLGKQVRVHAEDDAVTKDFLENRVNFVLDKSTMLVKRIYIG